MVFGLPAEHLMLGIVLMFAPILVVIFLPIVIVAWVPWAYGVYYVIRNLESILRSLIYAKQYPAHLKNR